VAGQEEEEEEEEVRAKPQHMLIRHDPSRCGTREARTQDCTI
jgi:hypothetical protein